MELHMSSNEGRTMTDIAACRVHGNKPDIEFIPSGVYMMRCGGNTFTSTTLRGILWLWNSYQGELHGKK